MTKQLKINFRNNQSKIIFGFLLLTISLFLLFSFNSFWFNWKTDDDIIISGWDFATKANNILGWIGAPIQPSILFAFVAKSHPEMMMSSSVFQLNQNELNEKSRNKEIVNNKKPKMILDWLFLKFIFNCFVI